MLKQNLENEKDNEDVQVSNALRKSKNHGIAK